MDIFRRALYTPYLLCCIAIDEIDALTPKRNEKSGEHKVDVLCLLLSLIGGIKDVPNIFIIASTNRLNKIDDAFARRLEHKFYVGRLSADERMKMLDIIKDQKVQLPIRYTNLIDNKNIRNLLIVLTTNFSGAALSSFRSRFLKYLDQNQNRNLNELDGPIRELCAKVASDFQIKLGGYSIPSLLSKENENNSFNLNTIGDSIEKFFKNSDSFTGRVLIDIRPSFNNIQFECSDGSLKELFLKKEKNFVNDLIPFVLKLALKLNVPYFQLIDSNLVLSSLAFDENLILEMILEKLNEYEQYDDSMLIFDADTLVGVSESMSDSSFSPSSSYSFQNSRIWQNVLLHNFKSTFSKSKNGKHKWFIIISSTEFLINQLKKQTNFKYCEKEFEYSYKERICETCGEKYKNINNKEDSCVYHPDEMLTKIIKLQNKNEKIEITKENLIELAKTNGNTDVFNEYYYLCCMKRLNESDGCKKAYHREKIVENTCRHSPYYFFNQTQTSDNKIYI